jgi:hypothetical protein
MATVTKSICLRATGKPGVALSKGELTGDAAYADKLNDTVSPLAEAARAMQKGVFCFLMGGDFCPGKIGADLRQRY